MNLNHRIKQWISGITILLFLVGLASLLIGWQIRSVTASFTKKMNPFSATSLYEGLSLTYFQKNQIKELEKQYYAELSKICARHCAARAKIANTLASGKTDVSSLLGLQREVSEAYSAGEETTLRHIDQVSRVLDPRQRTIFLKKFADSMTANCPMQFVQ